MTIRYGLEVVPRIFTSAALVAVASALLLGCGGNSQTSDYVEKSKSAYDDLTASAVAISTRLGTATASDIPKVSRAANSQLKLVSRADAKLRRIDVEAKERQAHTALTASAARQRDFLVSVVKNSEQGQGASPAGVSSMRRRAVKMVDSYRRFTSIAPEADTSITNTGLVKNTASYAGVLRQPAPSSGSGQTGGGSSGGVSSADCANSNACPAITAVRARDTGDSIDISADYCDRTPGAVNNFHYTFAIVASDGTPEGGDEQFVAQTRACNTISTSIFDRFPSGTYTAVVRVDNLTNSVGSRAESSTFRIQ
mgnify:CR=1 FL=1